SPAQRKSDRAIRERVCFARVLRGASGRDFESRSLARCGLGIRKLSQHAHGRYAHCSSPAEVGTESGGTAFHPYRAWHWLQIRRLIRKSTWHKLHSLQREHDV